MVCDPVILVWKHVLRAPRSFTSFSWTFNKMFLYSTVKTVRGILTTWLILKKIKIGFWFPNGQLLMSFEFRPLWSTSLRPVIHYGLISIQTLFAQDCSQHRRWGGKYILSLSEPQSPGQNQRPGFNNFIPKVFELLCSSWVHHAWPLNTLSNLHRCWFAYIFARVVNIKWKVVK